MKNLIKILLTYLILILSFNSCNKEDETQIEDDPLDTSYGGGTTDCSYPLLTTQNLPTLTWMLEGSINDYQSYSNNQYFKFGSAWLSGSSYLCNGNKKVHNGWDIHRPNFAQISGRKVYAAYSGYISAVYNAGTGFAQGITIEHTDLVGNKFTTNYTHVDALSGISGTTVSTGQQIGIVADLAQNDHLHFSVRRSAYSNFSNRGALPKYMNDGNCTSCNGDPVFPEYFVNPGSITYQERVTSNPTRIINLSGNLAFGNVYIGNTQTKPLTISNIGNSTLTINSIILPSGYSSDYSTGTIPAGTSTTANISFSPQNMVTNYNGIITVNSNSTSGGNTINVIGSGVNNTSNPTFNPTINNYTSCSFGNQSGSGNCSGSTYLGSTIRMKVASYNQSSNTINFTISKCSGTFSNTGIVYIKQGDYCGNVLAQANYGIGTSNINLSVTPPTSSGTYTYTAVIVSATTDKFYTLSINVQY